MSLFRILSVANNNIIDDLGLLTIINAIVVEYERDKIIPQVNVILAARNIPPVKDIPNLLQRFYKIDYHGILNAIRVVNKPVSCFGNKDYNTYLKNERLVDCMIKSTIIEALKKFCFKKGMYALKVTTKNGKEVYEKVYMTDQTIRKVFLVKRGSSGNIDMEEETRIDRIRGQKTPPPMSKAQIEKVVTINYMFENKINTLGVGFDDLDSVTQSRWRNYVENVVVITKEEDTPCKIIDKFLQDKEINSRILESIRSKEEKIVKLFVKNIIKKYIRENRQMQEMLIGKFKDYIKNLDLESKVCMAKNNYEPIIYTFCQNLNQPV